jgi:hypothetical protein
VTSLTCFTRLPFRRKGTETRRAERGSRHFDLTHAVAFPAAKTTTAATTLKTIEEDFHWHLEILPQVIGMTGFERASWFFYNPVPPELAARCLSG